MDLPFYIKPTQLYVVLTFIIAVLFLDRKKANHKYLFFILLTCCLTEILASIFVLLKKEISILYSVSIIIHDCLWLYLLFNNATIHKNILRLILIYFIGFSLLNFIFFEGVKTFNNYTFILGAFTYIVMFLYISFSQLKRENLGFFISNDYLLYFSPILFFFGLSFAFAFKDKLLLYRTIIWDIELYYFIGYFVNIIYYTLINIYIYREKRLKHA